MELHSWGIYLSLVLVATATPGPAVLYITTLATLHGWRKAVFAALGNIMGLLCLGAIAVTGLGSLLAASQFLFDIVRYCGALYLFYMGVKMVLQKGGGLASVSGVSGLGRIRGRRIFAQAFGVAVSNPKAIVFLTALFPQFIRTDYPLLAQFSLLMGVLMGFSFGFLMTYAALAHRAGAWLSNPVREGWVRRISGTIFMGFGLVLVTSSRR